MRRGNGPRHGRQSPAQPQEQELKDTDKTKEELIGELLELRQRVDYLENVVTEGRGEAGETVEESRERFRTLFETATEGILSIDIETREFRYANPAAARILGYSIDELKQMRLEELYPAGKVDYLLAEFDAQAAGEKGSLDAVPCVTKDGGIIYVDVIATLGVVAGRECVINFCRDVTERKLADEEISLYKSELERNRDAMLSIINHLRLVSALVDERGRVTFLSDTGFGVLKLEPEEVLGKPWEKVFPLKDSDCTQIEAMSRLPRDRRTRVPVTIESGNLRRYWMDIEVVDDPQRPDGGKIFFMYDMTEVHDLRRRLEKEVGFHDLVGRSDVMQSLFKQIGSVAAVDWTVLIEGETGTGKELVARAIHESSARRDRPFVPVNCAGLTDSLLQSQLFGHKRGAFTGAVSDQKGVFEEADGGTIFLDEIGDISVNVQTSLLRVIETMEFTRLGDSRPHKVDARVVAATNRDLKQAAKSGDFRSDLLFRLRGIRVLVPPLTSRREDIPLLAGEFLHQGAASTGRRVTDMSEDAMRVLLRYHWPGNVRQLKSAVEYALVHTEGPIIHVHDLPVELLEPASGVSADLAYSDLGEMERYQAALRDANGNRSEAARLLGVSRATFYRHLERLGITD